MERKRALRVRLSIVVTILWSLIVAADGFAQFGALRGRIVDENGEPIEGVEVTVEFLGGVTRTHSTETNAKGDFVQVGLQTGTYKMLFIKKGYQSLEHEVRVTVGNPTDIGKVTLPKLPEGMLSTKEMEELSAEVNKYFEAGIAQADEEDYRAAAASFEKVVELAPDTPQAHYNLGFAKEKLGEIDAALAHYHKATELQPDYYEPYVAMGNIHMTRREWPESVEVLSRATDIRPEISTLFNLGAAAMNVSDIPTAQAAFEKVLELDPSHAGAHYQLGMAFINQAKNEEAASHLETYLELDPEGAHAATAKGILEHLKTN